MSTHVRSVSQAFAILRLLAASGPLTLSDVGRALDLSPSSCLNLLRTLVDEGAVDRESGRKSYRLAGEWAEAGIFGSGRLQWVIDRARPLMAPLARDTGATIGLWQVFPGRRVRLVAHAESDAIMRIQLAEGQRQPLGGGAVGRALAAAQCVDDGELARRFAEVKWQNPISLSQYIRDVRKAQDLGYAIDDGLTFTGVCSLASALPDLRPGFCISVSFFSGSRNEAEMADIGRSLQQLKHNVAERTRTSI